MTLEREAGGLFSFKDYDGGEKKKGGKYPVG